nr:Ferrochelatase [Klebsiella pneumoniae]
MTYWRRGGAHRGAAAVSAIFLLDGGRRLGRTGADSGEKRAIPGISFIRDYAEHPDYIHALAASVRASFAVHGEPDLLLLSYHGIPQRYANRAMIILSAVAIRRGNWFPRWGCRRSG